ncbi:MAG: EFR1 family ferrodoxin [Clostridium sp.]
MLNKLYFSPTGNTKKVVDLIADSWNDEKLDFDLSLTGCDYSKLSFAAEDINLVGVPSFGGRVPAIALTHLLQMKANHTNTILIVTYGNRDYDDTLLELKSSLSQNGFHVIAAIAAVTEHSIMPQFGAGRPNTQDKEILQGYAHSIMRSLESHQALPEVSVKGNTPYRDYHGLPLKPKADKTCNQCGVCANACPAGAIPHDDPSKTCTDLCITCMRCVSICPIHARKLNPALLLVATNKMKKTCSGAKENELFLSNI